MTTANPPPVDPQGNNPFGENNPFSDNPYAVPPSDPGSFPPGGRAPSRSMVGHVPVVAILMMVQGGLELLMGLGLVAMGGIFPVLMRMDEMRDGARGTAAGDGGLDDVGNLRRIGCAHAGRGRIALVRGSAELPLPQPHAGPRRLGWRAGDRIHVLLRRRLRSPWRSMAWSRI